MTTSRITVHQKPTCTTCRTLFTLLTEAGVDFDKVDDSVDHPDLRQRPIVERGDRAVLARPPERVREIL